MGWYRCNETIIGATKPRLRLQANVWRYYLSRDAQTPVLCCADIRVISRRVRGTPNKFNVYPGKETNYRS